MNMPTKTALDALTDKEKQTLRLIVRGHDAKSVAVTLGLSVHTINERLRDARRKLAVSSSREAARMLFEAEDAIPENPGDNRNGDDASDGMADAATTPDDGAGRSVRSPRFLIGACAMTLALGLLAFTLLPTTMQAPPAATTAPATAAPDAARAFLELVDQGRWNDSYRHFGVAFRKLNTERVWADVSEKVRTPLGKVVSRTLIGQEYVPAPPYGYQSVKFRTRFAKGGEQLETVMLDQEEAEWKVVGITVG